MRTMSSSAACFALRLDEGDAMGAGIARGALAVVSQHVPATKNGTIKRLPAQLSVSRGRSRAGGSFEPVTNKNAARRMNS